MNIQNLVDFHVDAYLRSSGLRFRLGEPLRIDSRDENKQSGVSISEIISFSRPLDMTGLRNYLDKKVSPQFPHFTVVDIRLTVTGQSCACNVQWRNAPPEENKTPPPRWYHRIRNRVIARLPIIEPVRKVFKRLVYDDASDGDRCEDHACHCASVVCPASINAESTYHFGRVDITGVRVFSITYAREIAERHSMGTSFTCTFTLSDDMKGIARISTHLLPPVPPLQ